jgi:hypothetical protein
MSRIHSQTERRRYFVGGSDARIIMGDDEAALLRLWREKRGEVEPEDLSGNLIVQLGATTGGLNRRWYERITHRMPIGWYIVAVCYATAVILLGWWPWSILLILLLFSSSKCLQFGAIDSAGESGGFRSGGSCR